MDSIVAPSGFHELLTMPEVPSCATILAYDAEKHQTDFDLRRIAGE
jgi:hypothetical protein